MYSLWVTGFCTCTITGNNYQVTLYHWYGSSKRKLLSSYLEQSHCPKKAYRLLHSHIFIYSQWRAVHCGEGKIAA